MKRDSEMIAEQPKKVKRKLNPVETQVGELQPTPRILFCVTGSVATIKCEEIIRGLLNFAEVKLVTTTSGKHFFTDQVPTIKALGVPIFTDEDEYTMWKGRGDPVLHIQLRDWADFLLIAPLSANTLASAANGQCNNLLTCIIRAWDMKKPIMACPAMNTAMWDNPFTKKHIDLLTQEPFQWTFVGPIAQLLECGDIGIGAMTKPPEILSAVQKHLPNIQKLTEYRQYDFIMDKKRQEIKNSKATTVMKDKAIQ